MSLVEQRTKKNMQNLGIYKTEFDMTISIYASLVEQYQTIEKEFKESKFKVEEKTNSGAKKSPVVGALENLRKDILSYSNSLGLTPQGLRKISDEMKVEKKKPQSKLEQALNNFGT
jgi:phage terminase small subunit